ncbi:protoporphyrinogen/coproporphyrinogen oxidase [Streptomyces sp. NPDC059003]|uniref:protoporphyrinogen/coproporphyrinogen oxidase n=1 Tax=Streptomyces sp. NPDC059003 TaxID=3346691 RepID=UPI0036A087B3
MSLPNLPSRSEIAVVGAGIAGLAAAFHLQERGHRVTVFEASDHVGGRMLTERSDGYVLDVCASMTTDRYVAMKGLIADAGLSGEFMPVSDSWGFLRDGEVRRINFQSAANVLRTDLLSTKAKLRVLRSLARILADRRNVEKVVAWYDISPALDFDVETARDYVFRLFGEEVSEYIIDPFMAAQSGASFEQISASDLLFLLNKYLGMNFFASPHGMGFLPEALAKQLDVRLNSPVCSVRESRDRTSVTVVHQKLDASETSERYAACILAVPPGRAAAVAVDLDPKQKKYLRSVPCEPHIRVFLGLDRAPVEPATCIFVPRRENPDTCAMILEHNKAPGSAPQGKGLLGIYRRLEWNRRYWDASDEEIVDVSVRDIGRILPDILPDAVGAVGMSYVHRARPSLIWHAPGTLADLASFTGSFDPNSRIQFAGDYFSMSGTGCALASGEEAAKRLMGSSP